MSTSRSGIISSPPQLFLLIDLASDLERLLAMDNSMPEGGSTVSSDIEITTTQMNPIEMGSGEDSLLDADHLSIIGKIEGPEMSSKMKEVEATVKKLVQLMGLTEVQGLSVNKSVHYVRAKLEVFLQKFMVNDPDHKNYYQKLAAEIKASSTSIADAPFPTRGNVSDPRHPDSTFHRLELERDFDFEARYRQLTDQERRCLLCFSLFPEGSVVERVVLMYWWVALGLTNPPGSDASGKVRSDQLLAALAKHRFILPVNTNSKMPNAHTMCCIGTSNTCRSSLNRRFHLGTLARFHREIHLQISGHCHFGNPNPPLPLFEHSFPSPRRVVYKMRDGIHSQLIRQAQKCSWFDEAAVLQKTRISSIDANSFRVDTPKIRVLLNVGQHTLNITNSFAGMDNVQLAHLGNWKRDDENHIVVADIDFFKAMKNVGLLQLLSLRGISGIYQLPLSVYKLENLLVLDLRACHNLTLLPEGIESLQKLTHLDLSECYLLRDMPKGIATLANLRVLKGFIINTDPENKNSEKGCAFSQLLGLQQLIKLSIRSRKMNFPTKEDMQTICEMGRLKKLRIAWVGKSDDDQPQTASGDGLEHFPDTLEKLELRAAPVGIASTLLQLIREEDNSLQKLYIVGGNLEDLGSKEYCINGVTQVRLRYLPKLNLDWSQCRCIFPNLIHMDIFRCPKFNNFPCGENGVWKMNIDKIL